MPQRPIPEYWKDRIKAHFAQMEQGQERLSDAAVHRALEVEALELRSDPDPNRRELATWVPSNRSISRIRRGEFAQMDFAERAQHRKFHWPESMEKGDLPWEAGAAGLEILRKGPALRPDVRQVLWFWRVTQVMPRSPDTETSEKYYSLRVLLASIYSLRDRLDLLAGLSAADISRSIEDSVALGEFTFELYNTVELLKTHMPESAREKPEISQ